MSDQPHTPSSDRHCGVCGAWLAPGESEDDHEPHIEKGAESLRPDSGTVPAGPSSRRVLMTTHKVVIDANNAAHAADLYERLCNDGYRVHREERRWVSRDGIVTQEVTLV